MSLFGSTGSTPTNYIVKVLLNITMLAYMMETLLDIKQNLIKENMLLIVVTVTLVFTQSKNIMLMFYDYSLVFCR